MLLLALKPSASVEEVGPSAPNQSLMTEVCNFRGIVSWNAMIRDYIKKALKALVLYIPGIPDESA